MGRIWDGFLGAIETLGRWVIAHHKLLLKSCAWLVAIISLPLLGLFVLPTFLALIAPPLDLKQDLYALNRPVAFTFLDGKGAVVGRRGAAVGDRLTLDEMPTYLSIRAASCAP